MLARYGTFFCAMLALSGAVQAELLVSRQWNGEGLLTEGSPKGWFPNINGRTAELVDGTSYIRFGIGTQFFEKLVSIPLVEADSLDPNEVVTISVQANLTRPQTDFDPILAVSDGVLIGGFEAWGNVTGAFRDTLDDLGNRGDDDVRRSALLFSDAGMPAVGGSLEISATIEITGGVTTVTGTYGTVTQKTGSTTMGAESLDPLSGLSFALIADEGGDDIQVNWLSIEVHGTRVATTIGDIILFFDMAVADGSLEGVGNVNSANGRVNALRNMLLSIADLLDSGALSDACDQIGVVRQKADDASPPPDFIEGVARDEFEQLLMALSVSEGC